MVIMFISKLERITKLAPVSQPGHGLSVTIENAAWPRRLSMFRLIVAGYLQHTPRGVFRGMGGSPMFFREP
jgi:hypothetical protein